MSEGRGGVGAGVNSQPEIWWPGGTSQRLRGLSRAHLREEPSEGDERKQRLRENDPLYFKGIPLLIVSWN